MQEKVQKTDWQILKSLPSREDQSAGPAVRQPCHTPLTSGMLCSSQELSNCLIYTKRVCAAVLIFRVNLLSSPHMCSPGLLTWVHDKANHLGQQPKLLENSQTKAAAILANYFTRRGSQPPAVRDLSSTLPALSASLRY